MDVPEPSPSDRALEEEARRLTVVADAIRRRADPDGFVPFDQFQEQALYTPGAGYYEAPGRRLGSSGDFYTAAHVSPLFGATLADRVAQEYDRLGRPRSFRIVEMGAGDGSLARVLIDELSRTLPDATPWEYVLVERSTVLRVQAIDRLASGPGSERVRVASAVSADGPFAGVVVANEFLDALPARRLTYRSGGWRELGVRWDGHRFVAADASARPFVGPPLPEVAPEGSVLEYSPAAEGFVRELADQLVRGAAIVVDYGAEESRLLADRPHGTLQAIRAHRVLEDPLDGPGSADLSTFVDFTRIRTAAASAGLSESFYGSQAEALGRWGFEARLQESLARRQTSEEEVKLRLAAKNLLFGFDAFRVVEWTAGRSAT